MVFGSPDTGDIVVCRTCLGTYNASQAYWTNVTVNNANRSWAWMVCNQLGYYLVGPPEGQPAIVSRIVQPIYDEVCALHACEKWCRVLITAPDIRDSASTCSRKSFLRHRRRPLPR
jgi:hypothetical protein